MTKTSKICLFIFVVLLVALLAMLLPSNTVSYSSEQVDPVLEEPAPIEKPIETPKPKPRPASIAWTYPEGTPAKTAEILDDLIHCESRGYETAINEVDRDGTASYGLLQFKPSTFQTVLKQYIDPTITPEQSFAKIYDGKLQIKAFIAWYGEGKPISWWEQQFPACSKLYGYWL